MYVACEKISYEQYFTSFGLRQIEGSDLGRCINCDVWYRHCDGFVILDGGHTNNTINTYYSNISYSGGIIELDWQNDKMIKWWDEWPNRICSTICTRIDWHAKVANGILSDIVFFFFEYLEVVHLYFLLNGTQFNLIGWLLRLVGLVGVVALAGVAGSTVCL